MSTETLPLLQSRPEILEKLALSVAQAFEGLTGLKASVLDTMHRHNPDRKDVGMAGLARFEGPALVIEVALCLPRGGFAAAESGGLGEQEGKPEELAGEVLNIAFGMIAPHWKAMGFPMRSSFPIPLSEKKWKGCWEDIPDESATVSFLADGKKFFLEVFPGASWRQAWKYSMPEIKGTPKG